MSKQGAVLQLVPDVPDAPDRPDRAGHEVLNANEVAAWLRCSRKSVYEAAARNRIPHQKLGRRILFSRSALLDWLACKGSSEREV
jgi:excisionase family DNA binding protein